MAGIRPVRLNVGGGFPSHRVLGGKPDLQAIFTEISQMVAECFGADAPLLVCEPGRGLCADAFAIITRVKAVRDGTSVFLNDGVYGGMKDPMPMLTLFDKQVTLTMGQCNVRRWVDDLLPLLDDPSDPLGVLDLTTHTAPLEDAPALYGTFQKKEDGCIKVVLKP